MRKLLLIITLLIISPQITRADFASGLVGYWPLDYRDNVWTSSSIGTTVGRSGNTGTFTNMTRSASPSLGKLGQAFTFNGSSQDIAIASASYGITTNYTLSAWVKTLSATTQIIMAQDDLTGNQRNFQFRLETTGKVGFVRLSVGTLLAFFTSNKTVNDGKWHHIIATFSNSVGSVIYIDGVLDATDGVTTNNGNGNEILGIGNYYSGGVPGSGNYFNGQLDDLRVYARTLSALEVNQLYRQNGGSHDGSFMDSVMGAIGGLF